MSVRTDNPDGGDDYIRRDLSDPTVGIIHTTDDLLSGGTSGDGSSSDEEPGGDSGQVEEQGGASGGGGGGGWSVQTQEDVRAFREERGWFDGEGDGGGLGGGLTVAAWVAVALVLGVGLWWTVRGRK